MTRSKAGFKIESAAEIEDFTFPMGISRDLVERRDYYVQLAEQVFDVKRSRINTTDFENKYARPALLKNILSELNQLHPFVTVPIFKIVAVRN